MKQFTRLPKNKKIIVMVAYGGVGEFLFQLDLAKRFENEGAFTLFLVKNRYSFFCDIAKESNLKNVLFIDAPGVKYYMYMFYIWAICISRDVTIVNSFNSLFYRLPTKLFYGIAKFLSARVITSKHSFQAGLPYEQVPYKKEMIWERNARIVTSVFGDNESKAIFPVLGFVSKNSSIFKQDEYIHIHPVGSSFKKSYPSKKLLEVLMSLIKDTHVLLTMTPGEESWYMTDELRNFIRDNKDRVVLDSRYFSAKEIISYIKNSKMFCTVNTGLLWFSILLQHKTVVLDTFTDYEWNPSPYKDVTRLAYDYDEHGKSLHLVTKEHEDGVYFESMYLIKSEEVCEAIRNAKE